MSIHYNAEPFTDPEKKNPSWLIGDAFIIGLLIIEGKKIGFWPRIDADFQGISFVKAAQIFRNIPDPRDYSVKCPSGRSFFLGHRSIPKESFEELIDTIEEREIGVSIYDYKERMSTVG